MSPVLKREKLNEHRGAYSSKCNSLPCEPR